MNIRFVSTLVVALSLAVSVALASGGEEKTKKAAPAKKEMKSCCSGETKSAKECSDMEMKDARTKGASSSHQTDATKTEKKQDVNEGEKK